MVLSQLVVGTAVHALMAKPRESAAPVRERMCAISTILFGTALRIVQASTFRIRATPFPSSGGFMLASIGTTAFRGRPCALFIRSTPETDRFLLICFMVSPLFLCAYLRVICVVITLSARANQRAPSGVIVLQALPAVIVQSVCHGLILRECVQWLRHAATDTGLHNSNCTASPS